MAITFDGINRLIRIDEPYSVAYITSRWKDWVIIGDNAKFPPAFFDIAGNDLGGGANLEVYSFIRNDLGWRIQPFGMSGLIPIDGEIYANDPNQPFDIAAESGDYALFRFQGSSRTQGITSVLELVEELKKYHANRRTWDRDAETQTIYDDDKTTVFKQFNVTDNKTNVTEIDPI